MNIKEAKQLMQDQPAINNLDDCMTVSNKHRYIAPYFVPVALVNNGHGVNEFVAYRVFNNDGIATLSDETYMIRISQVCKTGPVSNVDPKMKFAV